MADAYHAPQLLLWMWPPLSLQFQFVSSGIRDTAKGPAASTYTSVQSVVARTGEASATLSDEGTESWEKSWTLTSLFIRISFIIQQRIKLLPLSLYCICMYYIPYMYTYGSWSPAGS